MGRLRQRRIVAQGPPDEVFTAGDPEPDLRRRHARRPRRRHRPGRRGGAASLREAHRHATTARARHHEHAAPTTADGTSSDAAHDRCLTEPFEYEFFRHGLVAATLVGALCGLIGVYVVLRRMSYIGHGLSHAVFGGAVVSYVISSNFYLGAGLWGFLSALLINATARRRQIGADAAIGIVTTASFALGVALISKYAHLHPQLRGGALRQHPRRHRRRISSSSAASPRRSLALSSSPTSSCSSRPSIRRSRPVYGVRRRTGSTRLSRWPLAGTIVASMNVVGVTLIAAAIVIPPIIARLLTDSFGPLLILSTLLGALCGVVGMFLSYYLDVASGAAIVLLAASALRGHVRGDHPASAPRRPAARRALAHGGRRRRARSIAGLFD